VEKGPDPGADSGKLDLRLSEKRRKKNADAGTQVAEVLEARTRRELTNDGEGKNELEVPCGGRLKREKGSRRLGGKNASESPH